MRNTADSARRGRPRTLLKEQGDKVPADDRREDRGRALKASEGRAGRTRHRRRSSRAHENVAQRASNEFTKRVCTQNVQAQQSGADAGCRRRRESQLRRTTRLPTRRSSTTTISRARKRLMTSDYLRRRCPRSARSLLGAEEDPGAGDTDELDGSGEIAAAQVIDDIDALQRERDDLLDTVADGYKPTSRTTASAMLREQTALVERSTEGLVEQLLPGARQLRTCARESRVCGLRVGRRHENACARDSSWCYAELFGASWNEPGSSRIRRARCSVRSERARSSRCRTRATGEPHVGRRLSHRLAS